MEPSRSSSGARLALLTLYCAAKRAEAEAEAHRLRAMADAAHPVRLALDVPSVARAFLEACRHIYPQAVHGQIVLLDSPRGRLVSPPVRLGPFGVTSSDNVLDVALGEGLLGEVFVAGQGRLIIAADEAAAPYTGARINGRKRRRDLTDRYGQSSVIAVPLRASGRPAIGVLALWSRGWGQEDLDLLEGMAEDVALAFERARLYEEQRDHAATDPLTGLKNRRAFEAVLKDQTDDPSAILAIDVDNLKPVNDKYGHEAGDLLLKVVAATLALLTRRGDCAARVGGDEFAILLLHANKEEAYDVGERMRRALYGVAFPYGQARISVGIASGTRGSDLRAVWRSADEALIRAKHQGRDRVVVLGGRSSANARSHSNLVTRVLEGHTKVRSLYQPIVRVTDGMVVGYEALARVGQRSRGLSGVEELFATAQRSHLLRDLDWLCRRSAIEYARTLPEGVPLFINVTASALLDPVHEVDQMLLLLHLGRRSPSEVVLEITERETIWDLRRLSEVLAAYREQGFRFALDDVGEGHSTLELLATTLPEYLKIARSLIVHSTSPGARAAVEAAKAFARSAGTAVIAEGVETEVLAERVADLGIELAQGYWLGMPVAQPASTLRRRANDEAMVPSV